MGSGVVFLVSCAAIIFAAMAGFGLHCALPAAYLAASNGMISSIVGLIASLLSIVLGLLVWTAYGQFTAQQAELQTIARAAIQIDVDLMAYGADAAPTRGLLRQQVAHTYARLWDGKASGLFRPEAYDDVRSDAESMLAALGELRPTNDDEKRRLTAVQANYATFVETQATMIRNLANRVPTLLLMVVLGWSCLLFLGYGLLAPLSALTAVSAVVGAAAVATAILLILELSDPFSGLFRMPDAGFKLVIKALSADAKSKGAQAA
jgi:Protein of unknown function (DUF4239)